jgi:hypothetical protein
LALNRPSQDRTNQHGGSPKVFAKARKWELSKLNGLDSKASHALIISQRKPKRFGAGLQTLDRVEGSCPLLYLSTEQIGSLIQQ